MLNDELSIKFINRFQGGFPVTSRPFADVAGELDTDEATLIEAVKKLVNESWLSRFGPLYNATRMGGGLTLAAIAVPENRFDEVTAQVNAYSEVAHNYRREHRLNMWFVVATETGQALTGIIHDIQQNIGLKVYNCPKIQEFYVGLQLILGQDGMVDTIPLDRNVQKPVGELTAIFPDGVDRQIIAASQAGLPLTERPYEYLANQIGGDGDDVMRRFNKMIDAGIVRRIGAIPNHYRLGLRGNGMTVWDVPDERVTEVGEKIAAMDFVSHCYLRPRHLPEWPYNIFAMVHGADRSQVRHRLAELEQSLKPDSFSYDVLFSTAVLKKSGLRIAA